MTHRNSSSNDVIRSGLLAGVIAYVCWGFFPVYFKLTQSVPTLEILAHRIVWSIPFGLLIILFRKQVPEVITVLKSKKTLALLFLAAITLAMNWGIYIFAVQKGDIFQASLGYYINPLFFVLIGVVFLGESLNKAQIIAVVLASFGVGILTLIGGEFPWVAMMLAVTFTAYGVIRKQVDVGAMPGLFVETLVLVVPAITYLLWLSHHGNLSFLHQTPSMDWMMIAAGPVTVLPLLAFAFAARRLRLSTIGFLQFIGPTLQFLTGLYYGEKFTPAYGICFSFIWLAVLVFSFDAIRNRPKRPQ